VGSGNFEANESYCVEQDQQSDYHPISNGVFTFVFQFPTVF
jgi:hypothetical protein